MNVSTPRLLAALGAVLLVGGASTAQAQPLQGTLNFSGALRVAMAGGLVNVDILAPGTGVGQVSTSPFSQKVDFTSPMFAGKIGTHVDLANLAPGATYLGALTFATAPGVTFNITDVLAPAASGAACGAAAAAGQVCGIGAFNFQNTTATSSQASFTVRGTVDNNGALSYFQGVYSAPFANRTYQQVIAAAQTGHVETSFSAEYAAVVPEPSTYALMATGLVALGGVARRRRQA